MKTPKRLILLIVLVGLVSSSCQTFTLTKEEFEKQQRGELADPEVGAVVGVAGSVAYIGAAIGAAVAGVK